MMLFGHTGLTTGIMKGVEAAACRRGRRLRIDYRLVLIGSLLPDLIDKPIGMIFFRGVFHNSRLFAHTLLFTLALLLAGSLLLRFRRGGGVLTLGVSSLIHLILDSMWFYPSILFWPFLSVTFPTRPAGNWVTEDMAHLLHAPFYMGAELFGLAVLLFYLIRAARRKRLGAFLRRGEL